MSQELDERPQRAVSLDRDAAIERAFQFFLGDRGWRPSTLARKSGIEIAVVHEAVTGYPPSLATLRRLCHALEVDLWLFFLMVDLSGHDDPAAFVDEIIHRLRATLADLKVAKEPAS